MPFEEPHAETGSIFPSDIYVGAFLSLQCGAAWTVSGATFCASSTMLGRTAQLRYDAPFLIDTGGYSSHSVSLADAILFALTVVVAWFISSSVCQYLRLRHFDGPLLAKVSNLWLFASVNGGRSYLDFWQATQKYGK